MTRSAFTNVGVKVLQFNAATDTLESMKPSGDATYRVIADTDYAVYVEFGTKNMAAQPYLRPAVNQALRESGSLWEQSDGDIDEFVEKFADKVAENAQDNAPVDTGTLRDSIRVEQVN